MSGGVRAPPAKGTDGPTMLMPILFAVAVFGMLALVYMAMSGPSAGKSVKRRLELLRERHGPTRSFISGRAPRTYGFGPTTM